MKITTRNGQVFIVPKLTWPDIQGSIHLATDGDGKWFGPTEIIEIADHHPDSDLQEIVKRIEAERDELKAKLADIERVMAVLRVENDALKQNAKTAAYIREGLESEKGYHLKKIDSLNTLCQQRSAELAKLRSGQQPITQRFEITIKPV